MSNIIQADSAICDDKAVLNRLAVAVKRAFTSTMTSICGSAPTPALSNDVGTKPGDGLIATLSFSGAIYLNVALGVPKDTAGPLGKKVAGVAIPFDSDNMSDLVAELVNVVAGEIIAQLEEIEMHVKMDLPVVSRGTEAPFPVSRRIEFKSGEGPYWVDIAAASSLAAAEATA